MPQKQTTIDDLAGMVKDGFDEAKTDLDSVKTDLNSVKTDVNQGFGDVKSRLNVLGEGQEEIKLKLDNVAYRFELKELQRRVELLEKKAGVK